MLTVVDHEVVAVTVHVGQGAGGDLVRRKLGGRLGADANRAALGEVGTTRPHHVAAAERIAKVPRPRMHDRAVADVDPVMQIGDGRAGDPMLDLQTIPARHVDQALRTSPSLYAIRGRPVHAFPQAGARGLYGASRI